MNFVIARHNSHSNTETYRPKNTVCRAGKRRVSDANGGHAKFAQLAGSRLAENSLFFRERVIWDEFDFEICPYWATV